MNRQSSAITLITVLLSVHTFGCSGSSAAAADPTARPTSCKANECDVAYDRCKATHAPAPDLCQQCNNECNGIDPNYAVECLQTCEEICSHPSAPDTVCEDERTTCEKTTQNAICTDGLDPANVPGERVMDFPWTPPAAAHTGACSDVQLVAYKANCLSAGTPKACQAFLAANAACSDCLLTSSDASAWGPYIGFNLPADEGGQLMAATNDVGCVATIDGDVSENGCGAKIFARDSCYSACYSATDNDACTTFASAHECKAQADAAADCYRKLGLDQTGTPFDVCGLEKSDDASQLSLVKFFCGH